MTNHQKGSTANMIGALLLLLTIIIRHGTDNATAQRWANDILPAIAFVLIGIGIRYQMKARKEAAPPPR